MSNQLVQRIKEDGQVTRAVFEYMDEVFEGQYGEEYSDHDQSGNKKIVAKPA